MAQELRQRLIIKAAEFLMPEEEVRLGGVGSFDGEIISYIDYDKVSVTGLVDALLAELKPVMWRVKDFADGWTLFDVESEALQEAKGAGNLVEALAVVPAIPDA